MGLGRTLAYNCRRVHNGSGWHDGAAPGRRTRRVRDPPEASERPPGAVSDRWPGYSPRFGRSGPPGTETQGVVQTGAKSLPRAFAAPKSASAASSCCLSVFTAATLHRSRSPSTRVNSSRSRAISRSCSDNAGIAGILFRPGTLPWHPTVMHRSPRKVQVQNVGSRASRNHPAKQMTLSDRTPWKTARRGREVLADVVRVGQPRAGGNRRGIGVSRPQDCHKSPPWTP